MSYLKVRCIKKSMKESSKCQAIFANLFFSASLLVKVIRRSSKNGGINKAVRRYWTINYISSSDRILREWQGVYGLELGRMSICHHQKYYRWVLSPQMQVFLFFWFFFRLTWMCFSSGLFTWNKNIYRSPKFNLPIHSGFIYNPIFCYK